MKIVKEMTKKWRAGLLNTKEGKKKRGVSHAEDEEEYRMAFDDLTGEELPAKEVRKARLQEVKYIEDKQVWRK